MSKSAHFTKVYDATQSGNETQAHPFTKLKIWKQSSQSSMTFTKLTLHNRTDDKSTSNDSSHLLKPFNNLTELR